MADTTLQMVLDARRAKQEAKEFSKAAEQIDKSTAKAAENVDRLQERADVLGKAMKRSTMSLHDHNQRLLAQHRALTQATKSLTDHEARMQSAGAATRKAAADTEHLTQKTGMLNNMLKQGAAFAASFVSAFALYQGIRSGISTIASFEEQIKVLTNVVRASEEQMAKLEQTALKYGATTRFTARQAADGLTFLARAGFDTEEAIAALPATLNLAQVGLLDLGTAADHTSNIVRQFGLAASEAARVTDALVTTSNAANTNIELMAESMKFAGPVAGSLGISVEEASAALGVFGNAGIKGAMAGTSLRMILLQLLDPTKEARKAIESLGLSVEDVNPALHDLGTIFERLADHGMSAEEAIHIFTARQVAAALMLAKNVDVYRDLVQLQIDQAGAAEKAARVMDDSLVGAYFGLVSAIEGAILNQKEFGGTLQDTANTMAATIRILSGYRSAATDANTTANVLAGTIRILRSAFLAWMAVSVFTWLGTLAKNVRFSTAVLLELRAATLATAASMATSGPLMAGITAVTGGFRALAVAIKGLWASLGPVGWLIIGLTAVVELFFWQKRRAEEATRALEEYKNKQQELLDSTNALLGAQERWNKLHVEFKRATDTENLEAQLQSAMAIRRQLEEEILRIMEAGLTSDPRIGAVKEQYRDLFMDWVNVDDLRRVMETAGEESGKAFLDAYLEEFRKTDIAARLNMITRPPTAEEMEALTEKERREILKRGLQPAEIFGTSELTPAISNALRRVNQEIRTGMTILPDLPLKELLSVDEVWRIPAADALELLNKLVPVTEERVEDLTQAVLEWKKAQEQISVSEFMRPAIEALIQDREIIEKVTKVFQDTLDSLGGVTEENITKALRAAANESEVLTAKLDRLKEAKKQDIELTEEVISAFEAEVRKTLELQNAQDELIDSMRKKAKEDEEAANKRRQAQAQLDGLIKAAKNEVEILQLAATFTKDQNDQREVAIALLRAEQLARELNISLSEEQLKQLREHLELQQKLKKQIDGTKASLTFEQKSIRDLENETALLQREVELLSKSNIEREVGIGLLQAEQRAREEGVKDLEAYLSEVEKQLRLQAQLRAQLEKSEYDRGLEALYREKTLIGLTNDERERAERLIQIQEAAERKFGKGTEEATKAVEEYMRVLQEVQELRELQEVADSLARSFADAFTAFLTGAASAEEAARSLANAILELSVQKLIAEPAFDFLSQQFGSLFGIGGDSAGSQTAAMAQLSSATSTASFALNSLSTSAQPLAFEFQTLSLGVNTTASALTEVTFAAYAAANALQSAAASGTAGALVPSAYGNVNRMGSITPFAYGGVVDKPTVFPLDRGMIGEAGMEVYAPVVRLPNNRVGIQTTGLAGGDTYIDNRKFSMVIQGVSDTDSFRRSESQFRRRYMGMMSNPTGGKS